MPAWNMIRSLWITQKTATLSEKLLLESTGHSRVYSKTTGRQTIRGWIGEVYLLLRIEKNT
jgi:hypothetical protein